MRPIRIQSTHFHDALHLLVLDPYLIEVLHHLLDSLIFKISNCTRIQFLDVPFRNTWQLLVLQYIINLQTALALFFIA